MAKGFFGKMKGGFKLARADKKVKKRFIGMKSKQKTAGFRKFLKKDVKVQKRYIRSKFSKKRRQLQEKLLEKKQSMKKGAKKMFAKKGGFNPFRFLMLIFAGWIVNQLPKIVEKIQQFISSVQPVIDKLKDFVTGIVDFFKWIGGGIKSAWDTITGNKGEIDGEKKKLQDKLDKAKGLLKKSEKGVNDLEKKAKNAKGDVKKQIEDAGKEQKQKIKEESAGSNNQVDKSAALNETINSNQSTGDEEAKSIEPKSADILTTGTVSKTSDTLSNIKSKVEDKTSDIDLGFEEGKGGSRKFTGEQLKGILDGNKETISKKVDSVMTKNKKRKVITVPMNTGGGKSSTVQPSVATAQLNTTTKQSGVEIKDIMLMNLT